VIVPFAAGVTDAGESVQVTAVVAGDTEQVSPTAELKPLTEVTLIVEVVEFPADVVAEAGDAESVKSFTVKAKDVVRF
jgi:hypothetical protein